MTNLAGRMAIIFETPEGVQVIAKGFFRYAEIEVEDREFIPDGRLLIAGPSSVGTMRAEMVLENYTLYNGDELPGQGAIASPRPVIEP